MADEYINEVVHYGHWKDSGILLKGEGAWSMTVMFLSMWEYVSGGRENYDAYRPAVMPLPKRSSTAKLLEWRKPGVYS